MILGPGDVQLQQTSNTEELDFSNGQIFLTRASLAFVDQKEENIAKYPLQFVWIDDTQSTE